jgi:hypothetical protein
MSIVARELAQHRRHWSGRWREQTAGGGEGACGTIQQRSRRMREVVTDVARASLREREDVCDERERVRTAALETGG